MSWIGVSNRGLTGELDMQVNLSFCQCDICDQKKERREKKERWEKKGKRERKREGRKEGEKELVWMSATRHTILVPYTMPIFTVIAGLIHTCNVSCLALEAFKWLTPLVLDVILPRYLALENFPKPYSDLVCPQGWPRFCLSHKEKP